MAIRNNLNDIVKVDIAISTPGSSDESFSNVLLVVEGPETGKKSTDNIGTKVVSISQASELVDYGFWRVWHFLSHRHQVLSMLLQGRLQARKQTLLLMKKSA